MTNGISPAHHNQHPGSQTPEEEVLGLVMDRKIGLSMIDDNTKNAIAGLQIEAVGMALYLRPHPSDEFMKVDYNAMIFEPFRERSHRVARVIAKFPADQEDTGFFNDVFFQLTFEDGRPNEHYLLNLNGLFCYGSRADIVDGLEQGSEMDQAGDLLLGDRFAVRDGGKRDGAFHYAQELKDILAEAAVVIQTPEETE